ncbi:MAG: TPM domain-containing protein [Candidatus Paceibacterota bacterium]|jgi:uncharacterized protein
MKKFLIAYFLVLLVPVTVFAYVSPGKPTEFVNDFANVLSTSDRQLIENKLSDFAKTGAAQITVVTVPSIGDETIESYSIKLAEEWKVGVKGNDNGLIILIAVNDRVMRFEVGYGLEGPVPDLQSKNIIDTVFTPAFKTGNYAKGISDGVDAVISVISGSPEAIKYSSSSNKSSGSDFGNYIEIIIFIMITIMEILRHYLSKTKSWWMGGVIGVVIGLIISLLLGFLYSGLIAIILLGILGALFDYVVSNNKHGGKGGNSSFFGGSGHSGGFGGGGFGGFGGGSFGGGGASGRW